MGSKENYKKWYESNKERARKMKRENMRRYRAENPEKYRAQGKARREKQRRKLLELHGKSCVRCGFSDARALTLDHILNNGAEERKEYGERGVYRRALKPEFAHEYQTLCMNCQFIKRVEDGRQNQHGLFEDAEDAEDP